MTASSWSNHPWLGGEDQIQHLSIYKDILTYIYWGLFITSADSHAILPSVMTTLVTDKGFNASEFSQGSK